MAGHRKPVRKRQWRGKKQGNKNPRQTQRRLEAQLEDIQAKLAKIKGQQPTQQEPAEEPAASRDDYTNRVVIKFFWVQQGKPTDPEEWKHRHGVISVIRRRMGPGAPAVATVERTLQRLVDDESDDLYGSRHGGRKRILDYLAAASPQDNRAPGWRGARLQGAARRLQQAEAQGHRSKPAVHAVY